jgi:hypothetical protein
MKNVIAAAKKNINIVMVRNKIHPLVHACRVYLLGQANFTSIKPSNLYPLLKHL